MAQNKRDDILNAAMELFGELGYDGTTVPMIAERAKVGAGTIYRYFENKESLVNILFQDCVKEFSKTLWDQFPESIAEFHDQFHHIFSQMTVFARNYANELTFIDSHCNSHVLDLQVRNYSMILWEIYAVCWKVEKSRASSAIYQQTH